MTPPDIATQPSPAERETRGEIRRLAGKSFGEWLWKSPPHGKSWVETLLRALCRIVYILWAEFKHDGIPLRASALTFSVILSLVPALALSTAVLKGLGAGDQLREISYRFLDQLEASIDVPADDQSPAMEGPTTGINPEGSPPAPAPGSRVSSAKRDLTSHLRRAMDQIFGYVERTDFAALGAFGIFGIFIAVVTILGSIEKAMNTIWKAESDRPLGRKVLDYLALMILLPLSINLTLAAEAAIQSQPLLEKTQHYLPIAWVFSPLFAILPIIAVTATFVLLYRFLPNTHVRLFPALAGGILAGLAWIGIQAMYIKLQIGVAKYNAIYGSFATLPLFLVWLQLGWMVFLTGAELAFAIEVWPRYTPLGRTIPPAKRLDLAFAILDIVMRDFHNRKVTTRTALVAELKQADTFIKSILDDLLRGGIIRKVTGNRFGYNPAATEEEIDPAEIVQLILGNESAAKPDSDLAGKALDAARDSVRGLRIGDASKHHPS